MTDARLDVRPAVQGLTGPTSIAFLGPNDLLVLEKATGRVKHVTGGVVTGIALDLAVNSASERGLLGIALHPNFPTNPGVYLYWTCRTPGPGPDNFTPAARECDESQMLGADTNVTLSTPLLGNRVDRFVWDAATQTLSFDKHLISLHSFQADGAPEPPGQGDAGAERGRQPQRRRDPVRSRRKAVRDHGRQRAPRAHAEPAVRPDTDRAKGLSATSVRSSRTTSSAGPSPTTRT